MGSAEVLAAPTEKVQFMEDMKTEVKGQQNSNSGQERNKQFFWNSSWFPPEQY